MNMMGGNRITKMCNHIGCVLAAGHKSDHQFPLVDDEDGPQSAGVFDGYGDTVVVVTGSRMPQPKRPETGYENVTDEYLAELLGGLTIHLLNPSNRALVAEAQIRLILRGGDDGYHETRAMTKPTLEGLERRLEQLERDIKRVTGIDPRAMTNAD
jgi:hypothetical protein